MQAKAWPTVLARYWGKEFQLRSHQQPIVENLTEKRDVLALLPTGEGKTLCFQLAGLVLGGLTLVVSPLLALIQEQVEDLQAKGLPAWQLSSQLSPEQRRKLLTALTNTAQAFLYLSPEQLQGAALQTFLAELPPRLLVIDEAHCISQWGRSFRPAYREIGSLLSSWKQRPVLGVFTATAPPQVQADISQVLGLKAPKLFQGSVLRDNIAIRIQRCWTPRSKRKALLAGIQGKTLIYARSRQATEELAQALREKGFPASFYHAGASLTQRQAAYQHFRSEPLAVLVATTAFGMGVDIPDIATVIHWHLPESLDAYVQEIGRGGRNRKFQAQALALWLWGEKGGGFNKLEAELPKRVWQLLGKGLSLIEVQDRLDLSDQSLNTMLLPWLAQGWIQPLAGKRYRLNAEVLSREMEWAVFRAEKQEQQFLRNQQAAFRRYLKTRRCRREQLERYFEVPLQPGCGLCDCCI